jgi:protein-tyrosine phosphatase/membrane-associated phospholipid phosphatase
VTEPRPWRRATVWLIFLGPFFFATYGFANWLASRHESVGAIAFAWERSIPFVPWTIVPYWSIDVLYAVSLFVCTTRRELDRHAQRLLLVQIISIFFFIAAPLRFSFDRPDSDGIFGALFTALGSFDKPFNQAPSLHIGLLIVIWTRLAHHSRGFWRWIIHAWMVLIGISVLTTYQHHFIDVPTGLAVGFLALWALPDEGASPFRQMSLTADQARRRLALLYAAGASAAAGLASIGGAWLWIAWPAAALGLVALNYAAVGARGFQKAANGQLTVGARALLAPYLLGAKVNSRLWTRRHASPGEVIDGVWIGRIPDARELAASTFGGVVDLTAELSFADPGDRYYRSVGILDLTTPDVAVLREAAAAIEDARQHGPVLVCCALGFSRSAAAVAAWLLMTRRAASVHEAMQMVRKARPAIVLNSRHSVVLEAFK